MHVRFQDTAEADLDAINEYLANKSQQGLERILTAIFTVAYQLESFPFLGREGEVQGTRELTIPRTEYRIVYTLDDPHFIDIIRVLHAKLKYPPEETR
jgi:addiction module RelE/StbE family toxin